MSNDENTLIAGSTPAVRTIFPQEISVKAQECLMAAFFLIPSILARAGSTDH